MPEWMQDAIEASGAVSWSTLIFRLVASLILGLIITGIYGGTRHPASIGGTFPATLVLLCVLIAMVTQVIGDNVARAFSLVGALSIVRFRTVVRDTKDTAFVIFAVAVGMAVGAGQPFVAVCGMAVVGLAALLFQDRPKLFSSIDRETMITIRLSWTPALEALAIETVSKFASEVEQVGVTTVRQGLAMDLQYRVRLLPTAKPTELVSILNRIEGIQTVDLQAQKPAV